MIRLELRAFTSLITVCLMVTLTLLKFVGKELKTSTPIVNKQFFLKRIYLLAKLCRVVNN
jgi:hypothetical protein